MRNSTSPGPARIPFTAARSMISPSCGASHGTDGGSSRVRSISAMTFSGTLRFSNRRRAPFKAWLPNEPFKTDKYSAAAPDRLGP